MCDQKLFGHLTDGRKTSIYEIKNGRISAEITDFGARIRRIMVPDRAGRLRDVCLGCETIEGYEQDAQSFGAVDFASANSAEEVHFVANLKLCHRFSFFRRQKYAFLAKKLYYCSRF